MKTKQELLDEVNGFQHLSEETKEKFRKVINTVEEDLTEDQWRDYELALIQYQDTIEEYRTAIEKGMAKGMAEGMAKGMEKGMAEGMTKGLAQGREEAFVETARALKAKGVDPEIISACTGLSVAEIQGL